MKKNLLLLLAVLALLLPAVPGQGQTSDEALLRDWIRTLGSDEFGGRKPMTPYETKTIDYLADQMKSLGLQPAFGDSYFQ